MIPRRSVSLWDTRADCRGSIVSFEHFSQTWTEKKKPRPANPAKTIPHIRPLGMGFSTVKSFSWRDQWRYSEAPDRRVKRAMEKDNKRHRDAGRREFNDTVKVPFP